MKLPGLNQIKYLFICSILIPPKNFYLLVQNSWYSPYLFILCLPPLLHVLLPMWCSALGGLQSSRDGMISLPAASTSGCVVLNLPARPTDKPQWWIRGVTIQSPAYLLQCSGRFMWWLCICVWAGFVFVCVPWQGGWFTHWVGGCVRWVGVFEELWLEREIISGSRKPNSRDRGRYGGTKLRETDGGRWSPEIKKTAWDLKDRNMFRQQQLLEWKLWSPVLSYGNVRFATPLLLLQKGFLSTLNIKQHWYRVQNKKKTAILVRSPCSTFDLLEVWLKKKMWEVNVGSEVVSKFLRF